MTQKQKENIIKTCNSMTDDALEAYYYDCVCECRWGLADEMRARDMDPRDIEEEEEFERYLAERERLVEHECLARKIRLWDDTQEHI